MPKSPQHREKTRVFKLGSRLQPANPRVFTLNSLFSKKCAFLKNNSGHFRLKNIFDSCEFVSIRGCPFDSELRTRNCELDPGQSNLVALSQTWSNQNFLRVKPPRGFRLSSILHPLPRRSPAKAGQSSRSAHPPNSELKTQNSELPPKAAAFASKPASRRRCFSPANQRHAGYSAATNKTQNR